MLERGNEEPSSPSQFGEMAALALQCHLSAAMSDVTPEKVEAFSRTSVLRAPSLRTPTPRTPPAVVSSPGSDEATDAGMPDAMPRSELQQAIFRILDRLGDGILHSQEMRCFAEVNGFDGDESEWQEEFGVLCEAHGTGPQSLSIDASGFLALLDDESDAGCYCSDKELRRALKKLCELRAESIKEDVKAQDEVIENWEEVLEGAIQQENAVEYWE